MRALDRKLLREVGRLRGQIATIALVLASGLVSFLSLRGTYDGIRAARDAYYDRHRFAHVFASLERAPEHVARRIEALPGVAAAETRVVREVALPIEGMPRSASGLLVSLPDSGAPATNALALRQGRLPEPGREGEVVLLESFAGAHGLGPGHTVPAVLGGKLRQLRVVGVALSPEYVYAIRPGALADDPKRYAIVWMSRGPLAAAYQLDGAFNEVSLRLQPGASEAAVLSAVDRLLAPYGGVGAVGRRDQPSAKILEAELGQLAVLSSMVPLVFLLVAAFLVNLVLGRLIRIQRGEIAALKAIGYTNGELRRHYLGLVAIVLLPGTLLGTLGGAVLGDLVMDLYASVFRIPDLGFRLSGRLLALGALLSAAGAVSGALLAVRAAVSLPPAEAMRPPAPARYRRGLLERLGLAGLAGPTLMMIVREVERRPLHTALSSLGIAGAVALMILGRFGIDSLDAYLEGTLRREQRHDLAVGFVRPVSPRAVRELASIPGVRLVEPLRAVPARIRHGHRARETVLTGLPPGSTLRRLVDRAGGVAPLPAGGLVLEQQLATVLGLRVGDRAEVELREGSRAVTRPVVVGLHDGSVGLFAYAPQDLLAALAGDAGALTSALLLVDPRALPAVLERLRRSPEVADVTDLRADIERLRDMNLSMMNVWTAVSILLSASIIFGVVYNNARIAMAARSRDLATLRVLGLDRREISVILIGGLAIEVALAVPVGLWLGVRWASFFMQSVDQELFRWSVSVAPSTFLLATAATLLAAALSALWVRRSLDRLDLIAVLKTRE